MRMGDTEVQKFCLTWKDFNTVFNREFNEVRDEQFKYICFFSQLSVNYSTVDDYTA